MTMELDDCITKDCSTIYRFQFASIAFICGVYLPFTFHSDIWSLYTQPFTPVNCTAIKNPFIFGPITNITTRSLSMIPTENHNRSECCDCSGILNGNINDKRLLTLCQGWMGNRNQAQVRKATIIEEVSQISFLNIILKNTFFLLVAFSVWKRKSSKTYDGFSLILSC